MNCDQVRELLEAFVLDTLPEEQRVEVEAHLSDCPDCQKLEKEYRLTLAALPAALSLATQARPPAALRARVLSALDEESSEDGVKRPAEMAAPPRSALRGVPEAPQAVQETSTITMGRAPRLIQAFPRERLPVAAAILLVLVIV